MDVKASAGKPARPMGRPDDEDNGDDVMDATPAGAGDRGSPQGRDALKMANATMRGAQLRDQPLTLLSAGDAVLRYPHPMTDEDFEWLMTTLRKLKAKLIGGAPSTPAQAPLDDDNGRD